MSDNYKTLFLLIAEKHWGYSAENKTILRIFNKIDDAARTGRWETRVE